MSKKYPDLDEVKRNFASCEQKDEIISLLKRARAMYISCKKENKQETGLWAWQCMALRKLLDRANGKKVDLKTMEANAVLVE